MSKNTSKNTSKNRSKNTTDEMKYLAIIPVDEMLDWKFCPLCGSELFEVYPGDFTIHTVCTSDNCDDVGAEMIIKINNKCHSLRPKK